jgi:selenium-binding protein 1
MGDGNDKLVTIDANPKSPQYGKVIHKIVSAGRAARRITWASPTTGASCGPGGLDDNKIFVFDIRADPAKPTLVTKTITNLPKKTGFVGPHTFYAHARPHARAGLSNAKDHGGVRPAGDVQQQGRHHRDVPDADRPTSAAPRATATATTSRSTRPRT